MELSDAQFRNVIASISDKDIKRASVNYIPVSCSKEFKICMTLGFKEGAKWFKKQLLKGNLSKCDFDYNPKNLK